ncbi:MAG: Pr6Pr family membrane protein [Flavobacteriales bacterium]
MKRGIAVSGPWRTILFGTGACFCWGALSLTFVLFQIKAPEVGLGVVGAALKFFTYLTHLTVLGIALVFTSGALRTGSLKRWCSARPALLSAILVYAILMFGGYQFMLAGSWDPKGAWKASSVSLHYVVPLMYACFWFFSVKHGALRWSHVLTWQLFPVAYAALVLVAGGATGEYPYPFLEVEQLGWMPVLSNMGVVLAGCIATSALVVGTDRLLAARVLDRAL